MEICILEFEKKFSAGAAAIWNSVVRSGCAFPQTEELSDEEAAAFFESQSFTGVALSDEKVCGLYILHPNNVGRCGHICNASYAVSETMRGNGAGDALVRHSIEKGASLGFRILQFNAVVSSNTPALSLYKKLGFIPLGTIPEGFYAGNGKYEDIIPHYISLVK